MNSTIHGLKAEGKGAITDALAYNGLGDRLSQTLNGGVPTRYVNDPAAGLTQVLSDGTDTYLYGVGRLAQQPGTGNLQYFGLSSLDKENAAGPNNPAASPFPPHAAKSIRCACPGG